MKKVRIISLVIVIAVSLMSGAMPIAAAAGARSQDNAGSMTFTLQTGEYTITEDETGLDIIQVEGFSSTTSPGDPMLPHKVYNILVPPDIIWPSLKLNIISAETRLLEGTYDIKPVPPIAPQQEWEEGKDIVNDRSMEVYGTDADFPESYLKQLPYSQMRKWKFTKVGFTPFQYNPVSKKITLIQSVTIEISYKQSAAELDESLMIDTSMDDIASQIFFNYRQAEGIYKTRVGVKSLQATYDYVIITTNAIQSGSTKLTSFVSHKQSQGYSVLVVTETQWGAVTGDPPNNKAEKIRQWLINNYVSMGILYVLLIGDPHPYESGEGDVPMKMCHPEMNQTDYPDCEPTPTDYFYADLTGDWDVDNDGCYGEWLHDSDVPGGVDFATEVYVGRIPAYGADYTTLDNILQKIIDYETEVSIGWRESTLLPMSFSDASTDGAYLAEQMKSNYLDAAGYSSWTMYQQGSACGGGADSVFPSNEELRGGTVVRDHWAANDYGIVCWWAHGNATQARVGYGACSDDILFQSSYCSSLDDGHPSFTYQCSCLNGYPENSNNLQYAILKQGGIGTVSATRDSWYSIGQTNFVDTPTNSGIGYEYLERLVPGTAAGEALYTAKSSMTPGHQCLLMNWYDFNLYGDPTTSLASTAPPTAPTVTNSTGASSITSTSARLNGEVTDTGNENPTVTVYWGTSDGETTPGSWAESEPPGIKGAGTFYTNITSLTPSTTYYYRCYATNSAGSDWADSTESFDTLPPQKLVGADDASCDGSHAGGYFFLYRFQAVDTGDVIIFRFKAKSNGNVKVAIYSDNSGQPGSLLNAVNTTTAVSTGWNDISITSTPVVTGNYYWLAFNSDSRIACYHATSGVGRYKIAPYGSFTFPDPAGGGFVSYTGGFGLLAGWSGFPLSLPTVTNSTGASSITHNSARLNGEVTDTGNEDPTVTVYWGTSDGVTTPGSWAENEPLGAKGAGTFYTDITSLTPSTTYYYRCYATNSGGEDWADSTESFDTPPLPTEPTVTNSTGESDVTYNSARLNGEVTDTGNEDPTVTVYWGTSDGVTTPGSWAKNEPLGAKGAGTFYTDITSLTPSTTYYYRCYATNSGGEDWADSTESFDTPPLPTEPTVTNSTGASDITSDEARLNGEVTDTGNDDPTVTVYWGTTDGVTDAGSWDTPVELGTKGAGTFYTDISGLTHSTTYYYRCYASNSVGSDWADSTETFTTNAGPQKLIGAADSTAIGAKHPPGYFVLTRFQAEASGDVATFKIKAAASGHVKVAIYADNSGEPGSLLSAVNTTTAVSTGWNEISITSTSVVAGDYYWLTFITDTRNCIGATDEGTLRVKKAASYSSFTFPDPAGTGFISASYSTVEAGWSAGPTAPTVTNSTGASSITHNSARLNGEVTDTGNEDPTVTVYWGTIDGVTTPGNWAHPEPLGAKGAETFYTDISSLSAETTYYYRCYATNSAGEDWADSTASFTTNPAPTKPTVTNSTGESDVTYNSARLNGEVTDTGNEDPTVTVYWGTIDGVTTPGNWAHPEPLGAKGAETFYTDISSLSAETTYYYRCYATNSVDEDWADSTECFTTPPAPTKPTVTNSTGESDVTYDSARLNGEVTDTGNENPTVTVYWGTSDGGITPGSWAENEPLGTKGAETFYTDITSLTQSTTYYYRCYATNSAGEDWADSTEPFTTSAGPQKLIGAADSTAIGAKHPPNYFVLTRFQAEASGNVATFKIKAAASGHVKVAIYEDNSGEPGSLLNVENTTTAVSTGWNEISITSTSVVAGDYYWLAFITDTRNCIGASAEGTLRVKKAASYSSFTFPDPAGTGFISASYSTVEAGWSTGPTAPTVTNSTGASSVTYNSARLNGEITDTGNEDPTVTVYWGTSDGVTTPGSWAENEPLGAKGAGTFYTDITGLTPSTTYHYRCYAINSAGEDWADSAASFITPPAPTPPEAPTLVSPGTAITFKWNASTGATKYWLQANTASDFSGTDVFSEEVGDVTSQEVTGFSIGTTYYWRVKAGNDIGWSNWSSVRSVVVNEVP